MHTKVQLLLLVSEIGFLWFGVYDELNYELFEEGLNREVHMSVVG